MWRWTQQLSIVLLATMEICPRRRSQCIFQFRRRTESSNRHCPTLNPVLQSQNKTYTQVIRPRQPSPFLLPDTRILDKHVSSINPDNAGKQCTIHNNGRFITRASGNYNIFDLPLEDHAKL